MSFAPIPSTHLLLPLHRLLQSNNNNNNNNNSKSQLSLERLLNDVAMCIDTGIPFNNNNNNSNDSENNESRVAMTSSRIEAFAQKVFPNNDDSNDNNINNNNNNDSNLNKMRIIINGPLCDIILRAARNQQRSTDPNNNNNNSNSNYNKNGNSIDMFPDDFQDSELKQEILRIVEKNKVLIILILIILLTITIIITTIVIK